MVRFFRPTVKLTYRQGTDWNKRGFVVGWMAFKNPYIKSNPSRSKYTRMSATSLKPVSIFRCILWRNLFSKQKSMKPKLWSHRAQVETGLYDHSERTSVSNCRVYPTLWLLCEGWVLLQFWNHQFCSNVKEMKAMPELIANIQVLSYFLKEWTKSHAIWFCFFWLILCFSNKNWNVIYSLLVSTKKVCSSFIHYTGCATKKFLSLEWIFSIFLLTFKESFHLYWKEER